MSPIPHLAGIKVGTHRQRSYISFRQRGGGSGLPQAEMAGDFPMGAGELGSDTPVVTRSKQGHHE